MSKTNSELLTQENIKLRAEVARLNQRCQLLETELHESAKKAQVVEAVEQSAKVSAAKEVIHSIVAQELKDVVDKLPTRTNGQNGFLFPQENRKMLEPNSLESPEWVEQYEPGVYVTLMTMHDGTRDLRRLRFSRKRFEVHQAETWWSENRGKVYETYNVHTHTARDKF